MNHPLFRIHEGGELASHVVVLPEVVTVERAAEQLESASHVLGSLACEFETEEHAERTVLRFVNYPRAKFGERTPKKIEWTARKVAQSLHGRTEPGIKPRGSNNCAVVGLRYGYEGERLAEPSELIQVVEARKYPIIEAKSVHVISVSPDSIYTEPALRFGFKNKGTLTSIARAASEFEQERFSLEVPMYGRVFMIETPHCTESDDTPYILKTVTGIPQHVFAPRHL